MALYVAKVVTVGIAYLFCFLILFHQTFQEASSDRYEWFLVLKENKIFTNAKNSKYSIVVMRHGVQLIAHTGHTNSSLKVFGEK